MPLKLEDKWLRVCLDNKGLCFQEIICDARSWYQKTKCKWEMTNIKFVEEKKMEELRLMGMICSFPKSK